MAKLDKHTWIAAPSESQITITIEVYAWDLSVRGAHLDTTHGFFNGPSVFLRVLGREHRPCEVDILRPTGVRYRNWRVATSMPRKSAPAYGFGTYRAGDYDELIDHPVEVGTFSLVSFRAAGVPHDVAITARHDADLDRLARDLKRLCEWQIGLFGRPAPVDRYVFLATAIGEGPRDAVDKGWLPRQHQVGITGRSIAPRFYFAIGIRGAAEHMVGVRRAGAIVAIDRNPQAPIFAQADLGIVADWVEAVPRLTPFSARVLSKRIDEKEVIVYLRRREGTELAVCEANTNTHSLRPQGIYWMESITGFLWKPGIKPIRNPAPDRDICSLFLSFPGKSSDRVQKGVRTALAR